MPAIRGLARGRTLLLVDGGRLFSERRAGPSVTFLAPDTLDRIDVVRGPRLRGVRVGRVWRRDLARDEAGGCGGAVRRQADRHDRCGCGGAARGCRSLHGPGSQRRDPRAGALSPGRRLLEPGRRGAELRLAGFGRARPRDRARRRLVDRKLAGRLRRRQRTAALRLGDPARLESVRTFAARLGLVRPIRRALGRSRHRQRIRRALRAAPRSGSAAGARPAAPDRSFGHRRHRHATARRRAHGVSARNQLTTGIDFNDRHDLHAHDIAIVFNAAGDITSTTDNASIESARKHDLGAFAQLDVPVAAWLTVAGGARFDRVQSVNVGGYFGDRTVSQGAPSGSVSIAARPWTPLTITAQVSRGFRDPTLSDRFYRGPVGRGFIVGNPDLGPERSVQFDVTARYDGGRWRAGASYYHYDIADLIERYQSGTDTFLFRNRGLAQIRGVELEAQVDAGWGLTLDVSAQSGRGRAKDDGAALDDIAPRVDPAPGPEGVRRPDLRVRRASRPSRPIRRRGRVKWRRRAMSRPARLPAGGSSAMWNCTSQRRTCSTSAISRARARAGCFAPSPQRDDDRGRQLLERTSDLLSRSASALRARIPETPAPCRGSDPTNETLWRYATSADGRG